MPISVFAFAALVVAAIGILAWALQGVRVSVPTRRRNVVRANLGPAPSTTPDLRQVMLAQSATERLVQPTMAWLANTARKLSPSSLLEALERRRQLAGVESWSVDRLLAAKVLLGGGGAFVGVLLFVSNPTLLFFFGAGFVTLGAFFAVDIVLNARARDRQKAIERAFANVIDQITICMEAGLGLDAALARAAQTGSGPLADELSRVLQDIQIGVDRQTALENMVARTDVGDIRHFVVAVGQANRYGVPVAQALRVQATEARERRRSRAEERAQKMSVTLLFPLIFCILPSLFIVLLGPAAIRIANLGLGG